MKKWNRAVALILLLSLVLLSLGGCGKKEKDKSDETEQTVNQEALNELVQALADQASEGNEPEEPAEPVDNRTPVQKFWGGDWYGIMWITGANGGYSSYDNQYWDAMATLDVDESGNGFIRLWYESLSRDNPVAEVNLTISEASGSGEMGAAISESGWMFANSDTGNGDVKHADWIIDPMTDPISSKYGNDMIHIEGDYLDGSGEIYYHFFLRKWGTLWDDVAQDPEMLIPGLYDEWYKPLVQQGYAMPDNFNDPGTVLMADAQAGDLSAPAGDDSDSAGDAGSAALPTGGSTYDGSELVLLDDQYCKVVIKGYGCNPYNESWIGYMVELTNKADFNINFSSYANPDTNEQTLDSLGTRNTCYFNGQECKTHFDNTINAGATMDNACLAIDGVTDISQLGNVTGYISVVNNETGEVLNNIPYSL